MSTSNSTRGISKGDAEKGGRRLDKERELARLYYMQGDAQKDVADRIGVSAQTMSRWVREGQWDTLRAAHTVSRKELVVKMLAHINQRLEEGDWTADEIVKAASAIEKLDKQTNIVTVIEVFTAYNKWLVSRMEFDPDLTPELVQKMNKYQNIYVDEQMSTHQVAFL